VPAGTLDIERPGELVEYLSRTGRLVPGERADASVLAGGVSNRTVLVRRQSGDWVVKQALARLRVDVEWRSDPARVHREAAALRVLAELVPGHVPGFVFEDRSHHLLCMDAVDEPHENWKTKLLSGAVEQPDFAAFGRLLARIHALSAERVDELSDPFADRSFFESLRLEPYYEFTAGRVPEAAAFLHRLTAETRARRETLVHGDYSPKNALIHAGSLVLLDFEVAHLGDPAFDLGFSLAHFLSKAHHLPSRRNDLAEGALGYWRSYQETIEDAAWAGDIESRAVRHSLACLLARVAGRSPLEYLSPPERARQQGVVLRLLKREPMRLANLVERFAEAFR
jgi:5-methylthioribose kinase